jgi:flagella basal body P-ring formation protein FlgA
MTRGSILIFAALIPLFVLTGQGARAQSLEQSAFAAPIRLKTSATVEAAVVRLDDLFEGLGAEGATPVARAPAPGRQVTLDAQWLYALARTHALAWRPRSSLDSIQVERASLVIEQERIEELLLDAFAERGLGDELALRFDQPQVRLHLPTDSEATLALASLALDPANGRFTARIAAPAEGTPTIRAAVSGRVLRITRIPVPIRRLTADSVIGAEDIDWIEMRADRVGRDVITDMNELIGRSPRRVLRAGRAVRANEVRRPIVVAKNSLVTIRLVTPRMVLTAQGRAMENGAGGDTIRIMNTQSNSVINAMVVESNLVAVPGPAGP